MTDRTTKILLAAIAIGLWANAGLPMLKTTAAYADGNNDLLEKIDNKLGKLIADFEYLAAGNCTNKKIC